MHATPSKHKARSVLPAGSFGVQFNRSLDARLQGACNVPATAVCTKLKTSLVLGHSSGLWRLDARHLALRALLWDLHTAAPDDCRGGLEDEQTIYY
jgi:hypothetical protein